MIQPEPADHDTCTPASSPAVQQPSASTPPTRRCCCHLSCCCNKGSQPGQRARARSMRGACGRSQRHSWPAGARPRPRPAASTSRRPVCCQAAPRFDVLGLSNLCVDLVVDVEQLPEADPAVRQQLLQHLTAHPPGQENWELGGNANFMIAAARLGMRVGSVGHVGNDVYGDYMDSTLQAERIEATRRIMPAQLAGTLLDKTLLCFVLVDRAGRHAFCSRYDFGPWPLLQGVSELPPAVTQALSSTSAVFTNGFVFDELPLELVKRAIQTASSAGAAVLFDPGPRAFTMKSGSRRHALDTLMDLSDVVLMTEEEAVEVTGLPDPQAAAQAVLARPHAKTQWCVVKLGAAGALLVTKAGEVYSAPAFKVDVKDTVGCGDSFAAAIVLGFTRTHDVHATLLLANAVGAATAMGRGAGTNVASADTVLGLLQQAAAASSSSNGSSQVPHRRDVEQALAMLQNSLASVDSKAPAAQAA